MEDRIEVAVRGLVDALRDELTAATTQPAPDRLLDLRTASNLLGIGRSHLYGEMAAGRLRSVKVGRRRLIPSGALAAYMTEAAA